MKPADFTLLQERNVVYADSAATSLTPDVVLEAMREYYQHYNANVHRSSSKLGQEATKQYENARDIIATFMRVNREEIIFTRNCTDSLNLAAKIIIQHLNEGDEILIPISEHHSNLVVWQQLANQHNLKLIFIPVTEDGRLSLSAIKSLLTSKTKVITFAHVSNVLGVVQPLRDLVDLARQHGLYCVVDGAQGIVHEQPNMEGIDFYAWSGHKLLGPTGVGVLYGRKTLLQESEPIVYGGDMIGKVRLEKTTWNELPWKFEAGTPPIAEVIGLGAAVMYAQAHPTRFEDLHELTKYAREQLESIPGLHVYGTNEEHKTSVFSFTIMGVHAMDAAHLLNQQNIMVREGHHCAQPLLEHFGVSSFLRVSLLWYNTKEDVDKIIDALKFTIEKLT